MPCQHRRRYEGNPHPIHLHFLKSHFAQALKKLPVDALASADEGRRKANRPLLHFGFHEREDLVKSQHRELASTIRTMLSPQLGIEEAQEMVDFRDGSDRRAAIQLAGALLDGHRRGQAQDLVHIGLLEDLEILAHITGQAFQVTPLSLGKQDVEGKGRFARTAQPRQDDHLIPREPNLLQLQIVLPRSAHDDGFGILSGHC